MAQATTTYRFQLLNGETCEISRKSASLTHVILAKGMKYSSGKVVDKTHGYLALAGSAALAQKNISVWKGRGFFGLQAVTLEIVK